MIFVAAVFGMAVGVQAISVTTDATLSSLVPSVGVMTKASDNTSGFSSAQLAYRVAVPSGTTTFDLTPTATEAASTLEVSNANGAYASVASGTASNSYTLTAGVNLFKVKVTAPDTTTTMIYEVRVVKELNDNNNMLQISFTGMTSLPDKLVLLGANSLEVAWTIGTDLTNATWKNITNSSSATSLVYIPRPDVLPTVSASETWVMTVRGDVGESATRTSPNLYGFQGASSALGSSSTAVVNGSQFMKEVISLGQFSNFHSLRTAFFGSKVQLVISCKLPNSVRSLNSTFDTSTFNDPSISAWDVKAVTDLSSTFNAATSFNQDLSAWYTGSVVSLNNVFKGASAFNKSIDTWNTSAVTNFVGAFSNAIAYNQPLNSWNTAKATTMGDMFYGATAFNQPLGSWNTSKVTNMAQMFRDAPLFNQNLNGWDVSKVTTFNNMFSRVNQTPGAFNNGLSAGATGTMTWNTVAATDMGGMFNNATGFNQDISSWNTTQVTTIKDIFRYATAFNQPLSTWNTANVTNFAGAFFGAASFNQPLNTWNTGKAIDMFDMFNDASAFNQPLSSWNISTATNLAGMFKNAVAFNQNLDSWDISNVTTVSNMFNGATSFNNGDAAGASGTFTWKMGSKLLTALSTFEGASAFNQDMSSWNTNGLINARQFVTTTTSSFNQSLAFLNVGNYGATPLANNTSVLIGFPSSTSNANVLASLDSWANRSFSRTSMSTYKFLISLSGQQVPYDDCHSYDAYSKTLIWASYSGGASVTAPTSCGSTPVVTWAPTTLPSNVTVSNGVYRFTPDVLPVVSGSDGNLAYAVSNAALLSDCSVSASGEVSFTIPGSTCEIKAYTTDPNKSIGSVVVTFQAQIAPGAPTINSYFILSSQRLTLSYSAGVNSGSAITKYEYSTDGGVTWSNEDSASPAGAPTSFLLIGESGPGSPNFTLGTMYNVKIRAFNTVPGAASNSYTMFVDFRPGAPTLVSATPGDKSVSISFTAGTNTGTAIQKYQYTTDNMSHWVDATETSSPIVATVNTATGAALTNGTIYTFKIRAVNNLSGTESLNIAATPNAPLAAPAVSGITASDSRLSVAFTAPNVPNGTSAISNYQYSTDSGVTWRTRSSGTTASPIVITTTSVDNTTLINGTSYGVQIRAFTTVSGTASATVDSTPGSIPGVPTNASAVRGNDAATVSWSAPSSNGGSAISGYSVTSSPGSFTCTTTGATTCDVTGLTNGTSYTFTVTATNASGTSSASTPSAGVTPATVPDAPVLDPLVTGNSKITVSWSAPASNGGSTVTSYTVSTSAGGFTCVTSNLTCELTGLTNGTSYTVNVKATNAVGDSLASSTRSAKPDVLPGAPTITSVVVGNKQLSVYFTAPASNGGSQIAKYYYTTNSGTGTALVSSTTSPLVISKSTVTGLNLVNGTSYTFQIAAFNSGLGEWSTSQSATPNVLPGTPIAPSAIAGEGKATVSWTAASANGGSAILGYTATSNPGSVSCTTTGDTSCEITGLTNGVAYTFSVVATNSLGNGPSSAATGAVKPDVAPGAPTNLSAERGDGSLTVSFTAGTNSGSSIVKYQYSFDGTTWSDFATDSSATTQTISDLTNGSSYTLSLRAVNTLFGTGSNTITAVPRAAPGAPASFTVTAGFKQISVSWATATGGGSGMGTTGGLNITKYQYSLNGGVWTDFAGTSSPQVITGLLNAVSYSVKIRAYSDIPGVESSSLSASPIKNSQNPLELTVAESVTWTSSPNRTATLTYSVGGSLTLQSTGGSGTGVVVYTATNDSACSVVNTTLLIPNAGATCKVTATKVADGDYSSEDSPTVWIVTERAAQTPLIWKSQSSVIFGQSFDVSYAGGSGSGAISITSQDTSVCTVSGTALTAVGVGTCTISIQKALSTNYNAVQVAHVVTVGVAAQSVSFTSQVPATPLAGDTYNITATSTSGAAPTFTIVSGDCTVSGGVVTFAASGDCVIRASATRTNYSNASKTQTISVGQRNQTLSFASAIQTMSSKTYGSPAFFADASTTETTLTPSYALGSGTTNSACSVSTSGIVQLLAAGICEIEVSQAGSAAVAAASSISKTFTVLPDQASQPHITSVSAGHQSITAAFIKPSYSGGSSITAYRVDAVFAGGVESTAACVVVAGDVQTCTISGLTNGTSYQVKVAAITLAGAGIFSDLGASRVPATNPAAVSAFTAVPDNTTIALSWEDPISLGGGTFDSYRIFYKRSSVSSYPSSYINVQSQSPTSYTITGLINGESYDVKIVTVTTANTASLTSNTAEAKETPRTVPDAPATVDVLEVAGKVVITWSAPQSDGGNPVNEYRVTINGSTCSLANALDNLCEITAPTSSGTYPIEVKAKNDAGYSSPATATFTKAGVPSSGGGGSSTPGGTESAPNDAKAIQILTVSIKSLISSGGQVVSVTGKNFTGVTTVLVGGVKAKIISVADGLIKFTAPRNTDGPATLTLKSPTASAEVVDAFTYSRGIAKVKVAWVLGFVQANTTIKAADKAKLRSALQKNTGTVSVTCVGYQSYSYNTAKDAQTAMGRAKQACNFLKSVNPKLTVKSVIARTTLAGTPSRKLAVQFKTSK